MIISMYYPLFEGQNRIGYVGADVYASRLGNLELSVDRELEAFYGRTHEIGMIAGTIHHVCEKLLMISDVFWARWPTRLRH